MGGPPAIRGEEGLPTRSASSPSRAPHPAAFEEPEHWLGPTDFLDLGDEKLRLRARSVTQLSKTDREKALALYGFVKRIPFAKPFKFRLRTPRQACAGGP